MWLAIKNNSPTESGWYECDTSKTFYIIVLDDPKSLKCRRPEFNPWVGKTSQRRAWQPIPVFLPGESHGQRSLVGYTPWGHKEPDITLHDTKKSDTMSVWSEGKLTSTALGRL